MNALMRFSDTANALPQRDVEAWGSLVDNVFLVPDMRDV